MTILLRALSAAFLLSLPLAAAETYELEGSHTYAYFRVNHLDRGLMTGVFTDVQGTFVLDGKADQEATFEVEVRVDSLQTWDQKRDQHLLGPDFFNAKRFKTIRFKSKRVERVDDKTFKITGSLKLRGREKTITATLIRGATGLDPWGGYRTGGNITFEIDRRDFGIKGYPEPAIGHKVSVDLYWEALRGSES